MIRFFSLLTLFLAMFAFGMAQSQITLNLMDRDTACELYLLGEPGPTFWTDGYYETGSYFKDLEVVQGDHQMRSVHDTSVILDGSNLTVSGSFLGTVSTDDPASLGYAHASANIMISFVTTEPSVVSVETDIPAGAEAWFFDLDDNDFGFDNQGPGIFTLDDTLVPGHEYLFQVFYTAGVKSDGPQVTERSITLSLTVAPDPVGATDVAWGSIKALFR